MLYTSQKSHTVETKDSSVIVSPGGVLLGNTYMSYRGGSLPFSDMINIADGTNKFQNSLLYMSDSSGIPDLQTALSNTEDKECDLTYPVIPADTTAHPVGLFTFFSTDGTDISLISKVV